MWPCISCPPIKVMQLLLVYHVYNYNCRWSRWPARTWSNFSIIKLIFNSYVLFLVAIKRRCTSYMESAEDGSSLAGELCRLQMSNPCTLYVIVGPSWRELWKECKSKQHEQVEKLVASKKSSKVKKTAVVSWCLGCSQIFNYALIKLLVSSRWNDL